MSSKERALTAVAALLLLLAIASMTAVCERLLAALWQAYKFQGYAAPGVITLNARTATLFGISSVALISGSILLKHRAPKRGGRNATRLAGTAAWISAASIGIFVVLSLSPLNSWL